MCSVQFATKDQVIRGLYVVQIYLLYAEQYGQFVATSLADYRARVRTGRNR